MTLPKETPRHKEVYISERYAQLVEMIKIAHKAFPALVPLLSYEMNEEEIKAIRERNRRIAQQMLNKKI